MSNAVPVGWRQYRITDVLRQEKVKFEMNDDESYPLLSVRRRNGGFFHRESLKGRQILTKTLTKAIPESFVISKMQVVHGACGVIEEPFYDGYLSASYVSFLSKDNRVHIPYFNYLCHTPLMYRLFLLSSHGVHIEKMTFDVNDWLQKKLVLPPLPEQQKIAAILSSVDNVIEKTRAQIDKLKDLKTGMMQELLTKGIGSGGVPHTEFKDSPVGRIPADWDAALLDEVASRGSGHTPSKSKPEYWNGGVDWVSLSDTNKLDQLYITTTAKQISDLGLQNSSAVIHPPGTVVLSRDAGIGKSGIITKEMAVSQHFMAWRCSNRLDNHFLYYILQFWKPKFENIAMGSTIKTIGLPFFKKLRIPVPPVSEQKAIAGTLKSIDRRIFSVERKLNAAMALKKALMQDLLTGKVRVNIDQKEPAVS